MKSKADKFARIVSTIFVPPSFTLLTFIFLAFYLEAEVTKILVIIAVTLVFGFILPILLFLYYRKKGSIVDIDASVKEERTIPMLISVLFFVAGFIILLIVQVNLLTLTFWFCYITNALLTVVINKYWKISAHAMGAAGPVAVIYFVLGITGLWFLFLAALVGWSRIQLKCHTVSQVLAGGLLAFISVYVQIYFVIFYARR